MTHTHTTQPRPPIIAILGHIDHGKSTLLDYIRQANTVADEAGGITQHVSAYEITHTTQDNSTKRITFIDTPGHEAFTATRTRGARVADIAILIISAEDGVKQQTLEALKTIQANNVPFVIAINKIDKPTSDVERVLNQLTEHGIYAEGRGGSVSYVPISAVTGEGVDDLLEVLLLSAELEELTGDATAPASGVIIEAERDPQKGITATLVIKNGTLTTGTFLATQDSITPVRRIETSTGVPLETASFATPVRIAGWSDMPEVGSVFLAFATKKEAERHTQEQTRPRELQPTQKITEADDKDVEDTTVTIPIILKADVAGSIDALTHALSELETDQVKLNIIRARVGSINENDLKAAGGNANTLILGFHTTIAAHVSELAERKSITVKTFHVIYELTKWVAEYIEKHRPRIAAEEVRGSLKVLKMFSTTKTKQLAGGEVTLGTLKKGDTLTIKRRENIIGTGTIIELQTQRAAVSEVHEGNQCGVHIATRVSLAPGDTLEATTVAHI